MINKLKTDKENLLFIGYDGFEEFYLDVDSDFQGWSFMGLRPETEENLRSIARENADPTEFFEIPTYMERYFDYELFEDDQERNALDNHDSQATRENEDGETLYLGFGTGTNIESYFKEHNITSYETYKEHFEFVGLDETEYQKLKAEVGF